MKKSLFSVLVGLSLSTSVVADDLQSVYQLALKNDPQVLRAAANVDISKQGKKQAFSQFLPQLRFSAGYSKTIGFDTQFDRSTDPFTPDFVATDTETASYNYQFTLEQSLFDMSTWDDMGVAKKRVMQSEANYALAQQDLIVRVSRAYFNVLKAKDDLTFVNAEKKAIERQLEQTKQRFEVGLTAITDVHEAQAQFDNAVAQEIRAENDVEIQTELLREITNQYHEEISSLNIERFSANKLDGKARDWVTKAESQNLEIKVQQLSVAIAKLDISKNKTGHYPTLSLQASYGRTDRKIDIDAADLTINPAPDDSARVGINLSVPIYSGGRTSAAVESARASFIVASENMELAHRKAVREVRSSYADVAGLVPTIKALQQAVVSAESALNATEAGFDVGTRTIVDVLQSTRNLFNAKRNLARARYDYILAVLALKQSAGTLSADDVMAINKGLQS